MKTAGVDESILKFKGPARVFESQDSAVKAILSNQIVAGDVVVIRYEGPKGGPGMQEMLYPTSYLKSKGLGKACALVTDGRFSGGTSGLSIGHASPEAAQGGAIGLVREGDLIDIDIPNRTINLVVDPAELERRRAEQDAKGWQPPKSASATSRRRSRPTPPSPRRPTRAPCASYRSKTERPYDCHEQDPPARTGGSFRFAPVRLPQSR